VKSSDPNGHRIDHKITALELTKPPKASMSRKGSRRIVMSWRLR